MPGHVALAGSARRGAARAIGVNSGEGAEERHALIQSSVTNWYLLRKSVKDGKLQPVAFDERELKNGILESFPAKIIAGLEKEIRDKNPMLRADQTVEEIDEQIEQLQQQRAEAVKRQGNSNA